MACFHPVDAWQLDDGRIVFHERGKVRRALQLSCGRCRGCRQKRARDWAIRCMHESQCHPVNSFVTLTYDEGNYDPDLRYDDFQSFMRRLRKCSDRRIRFFCCGEYGELNLRPHFHALLFGRSFSDPSKIGESLFRSPELERLWPHGMSSFGDVTFQSAGYVARYSMKKRNGVMADEHYKRVNLSTGEIVSVRPEFGRMSLKPGIGFPWFEKFWFDVYGARDGVVVNGKTLPSPRYYDKMLDKLDHAVMDDKQFSRYLNSLEFAEDCTPERLRVREICAEARDKQYKRDL